MRRVDRKIEDQKEIDEIINKAEICRLGLSDNNKPYIVAMNFGYQNKEKPVLYFHSAPEGKKIDMIKKNNLVCFQIDADPQLIRNDFPCGWGMKYRSVVGTGNAFFITEKNEKIEALNFIMKHYSGKDDFIFEDKNLEITAVIRVEIIGMSGKKKGY